MALLHPADISSRRCTAGERRLHSLLAKTLSDRNDILIWHSVRVGERELDFVVYAPEMGLLVVEVKDWSLSSIVSAGPDDWRLVFNGREEVHASPYRQAREGSYSVKEALQRIPDLCHARGKYQGRPVLPVGACVAFPNISWGESNEGVFARQFGQLTTLYREDFEDLQWATAAEVVDTLQQKIDNWFVPNRLTNTEQGILIEDVFAQAVVTLAPSDKQTRRIGSLTLDVMHERFARSLGSGPRLLRGLPGSGKTITLIHHALYRGQYDASAEQILFTCYNLPLSRTVRDIIECNRNSESRKVTVKAIYEVCGAVLKERVLHEGQTQDYYDGLVARALDRIADTPDWEKYDVILIDEGQDLSPEMLRFLFGMLRKGSMEVVIAEDMEQDLFERRPRDFSYASLGLDVTGRVMTLPASYRCTQQILDFAYELAGKPRASSVDTVSGQLVLLPDDLSRRGPKPTHTVCADVNTLVGVISRSVSGLINDDHVPPAEIGILYTRLLSSTDPSAGVPALLLERISEAFDQAQIPFCWFSRDSAAKMKFDLQEPSIKMGSIFSAKGIDFEHLFLIDAPGTDKATSTCAKRNLLFVGCTRARDHLTLVTLA